MKAERRPASEKVWAAPWRWNKAAQKAGIRRRVFCASMADVFEDRRDLDVHRARLFGIIEATPWLDWQLLTKRPEAVMRLVPERWIAAFPANVWIGTTVEDQRRADERIPHLIAIPAKVRFLSCEPLLGPLDLSRWVFDRQAAMSRMMNGPAALNSEQADDYIAEIKIHWIINGGESGAHARPMHPTWVRSLRDQCRAAGVSWHFKQWGEWVPKSHTTERHAWHAEQIPDGDGWRVPASLNIADGLRWGAMNKNGDFFESTTCFNGHDDDGGDEAYMLRVGKKVAGSMLDGVSHKAFPR